MKLVHRENDQYVFRLAAGETEALRALLGLYPVVETGYHTSSSQAESKMTIEQRQLLAEANEAHRAECRRHLEVWLEAPDRFIPEGTEIRMQLQREQLEWLLQILNDIRVGSWTKLGSPDPELQRPPEITPENVHFAWALKLSDFFQGAILEALG